MEENENKFETYFKDDLQQLEIELARSDSLYEGMQDAIRKLSDNQGRGTFRYLIDLYEGIIELQNQKQTAIKNKIGLKKIIMDYAEKQEKGSESGADMLALLDKELAALKKRAAEEINKEPKPKFEITDEEIDNQIDDILEEDDDRK